MAVPARRRRAARPARKTTALNTPRKIVTEASELPHQRSLTIIAQDPSLLARGKIVRATVKVPAEELLPGPCGYRVNVIDYDSGTNSLYRQAELHGTAGGNYTDPFENATDKELMTDPRFHAQNVYAIVMRTLARFEFALGRRVSWGSEGHQLHISPHAFADANAFYSREDRAIFFGYFEGHLPDPKKPGRRKKKPETIFTSLSHDIVAHETTHAILDGLRKRFLEPSSPDQAAFHEGFSDLVALLSAFSLPGVVGMMLDGKVTDRAISARFLRRQKLLESGLVKIGKQMGEALSGIRGDALRLSAQLKPKKYYPSHPAFLEEHDRGQLLVAPMLHAFLDIWLERISRLGTIKGGQKDRGLVIEAGARAADHLLTMAIRAIDYCPPVDLSFRDYLSALLTVDREVVPDDHHGYRAALLRNFAAFGIRPSANAARDGTWPKCTNHMHYSRTHFDSMLSNREEVFRFVWENRVPLEIGDHGYIEVQSVRPSHRIAPDGFVLRETIAEYIQILTLTAGELRSDFKVAVPKELPDWRRLRIFGGGTLIFDEYGRVKYQIANHLRRTNADAKRQSERLRYLYDHNFFDEEESTQARVARMHLARSEGTQR